MIIIGGTISKKKLLYVNICRVSYEVRMLNEITQLGENVTKKIK